ncbi:MAG: histidine kinase [Sulfuricurvum sp.]|uniref:sensor histidine kinase n=1 Tax=Sulfuricurvum sp. TaxID=2025608 RepID=UPI0025CBFBF0|nr:histidine kinase [Sulfuricurvum sp.]MBV5320676.1 histidine kinase [Sulfuricurvum sp.]
MSNIELRITPRDWISVLLIGMLFSTLLSSFGYYLLGFKPLHGGLFGMALGFFITLFSLVFITLMNRYLLPEIEKRLWNTIAAIFSFLSGFLGALSTYYILEHSSVEIISTFATHPYQNASIIGILTYLIGALMYRFVKTRNQKEHIDHLFVQSRVGSLETQLNPHFLYNALNSLAELIHQDPLKAEEAVLKISAFLRNTMHEAPLIRLDEEIKNAHDYIDLENIRFGGSIVVRVNSDSSFNQWLVPKFSIQLLCENALKHGMIRSSDPFTITIRTFYDDALHIEVSNSGRAITSIAFGIGLSNLQERLTHLCGGKLTITHLDPPTYTLSLKECHEYLDCR